MPEPLEPQSIEAPVVDAPPEVVAEVAAALDQEAEAWLTAARKELAEEEEEPS